MAKKRSFILNGKKVSVSVSGDTRTLWVLRDILGVTGPKYGCGINVCKACTCHINGKAFNPCSVPISKIKPTDEITTIEGLRKTVPKKQRIGGLHPMQAAWLEMDVVQCGYCQPGQIMQAVSLVNETRRKKRRRNITNADIETIRNICRCGTYGRIRKAIRAGAKDMPNPPKQTKRKRIRRDAELEPTPTPTPTATATPTADPTAAPTGVPEVPTIPTVPGVEEIVPAVPTIDLGIIQR